MERCATSLAAMLYAGPRDVRAPRLPLQTKLAVMMQARGGGVGGGRGGRRRVHSPFLAPPSHSELRLERQVRARVCACVRACVAVAGVRRGGAEVEEQGSQRRRVGGRDAMSRFGAIVAGEGRPLLRLRRLRLRLRQRVQD